MSNKWDEQIIVAPRNQVFENESLTFQGVLTNEEDVARIISNISKSYTVMRRGNSKDTAPENENAEINTNYKQPVPYAVLRSGSKVFVYKRLGVGGESRLHDKLSLGVGGHMNRLLGSSSSFVDEISENLKRELTEELVIDISESHVTPYGIINDDSNDVSVVHIGLLYGIEVQDPSLIKVRETDQLEGFWYNIEDLKESSDYEKLEAWSKIAVDYLVDLQE